MYYEHFINLKKMLKHTSEITMKLNDLNTLKIFLTIIITKTHTSLKNT